MKNKQKQKKQNQSEESKSSSFVIRMGLPEMDRLWKDLLNKHENSCLSKIEDRLFKKWGKALKFLATNPFYPGLQSHEISSLTEKYGKKVFESYLENNTPSAARMFWVYGPKKGEITILALEPHPEPGKYGSVKLSAEP